MKAKFHYLHLITILSAFFFFGSSVEAEFTCTGNVCNFFPNGIANDLNQSLDQIEKEYLQEILKNNTESAYMTNILSSGAGQGHVRRLQLGLGLSAAGMKKEDVLIKNEILELPKLPNGGASLQPSIHLDFNLGWVFQVKESAYLRRFSIFLHGVDISFRESDIKGLSEAQKNLTLSGEVQSYGGMVRLQLVKPIGFGSYLFSWNGINLGAGAVASKQSYAARYMNEKAQSIKISGLEGKWGGDTEFDYKTNSRTYNIDIRTGIGILWVAHLYIGGGYSWNSGDSFVSMNKTGPYIVKTGSIGDIEIPREYEQYFDPTDTSIAESGTLGLKTSAAASSKKGLAYAIGGLDLDMFILRATLEAVYIGKDKMGASFAFRISF